MTRPTRLTVSNGESAWDSKVNTNFQNILDKPFPLPRHTGDESDLESTFPAANYDQCWIWVDHSTDGWTIYISDGTDWNAQDFGTPLESIMVACGDESTAVTGTGTKTTFRMPYAFAVTEVRCSLKTACSSGTFTVDINEGGTSILSTKLTIDATEKTSTTAATPAVISDAALADDAEITIDVDNVGDSTGVGLKVTIIGRRVA